MKRLTATIFILLQLAVSHADDVQLVLPPLAFGQPVAGKRGVVTAPEYKGTAVHHQLYLPPDWIPDWKSKGLSWPVVVEYTGNVYPPTGSTGKVEDASLGYGLSGGKCIWVVVPFVSEDHKSNQLMWWGDEKATVEYAKLNVPRICAEYGGDPKKVVLCGFSRGAIAVNYIGLFDDEIAKLWCGFMSHDHYDGAMAWPGTKWGFPLEEYRKAALTRLQRLHGRPALVCQAVEGGGANMTKNLYLGDLVSLGKYTFITVPIKKIFPEIPNSLFKATHTDCWMFRDSGERQWARDWLDRTLNPAPAADANGIITLDAPWADIHGGGLHYQPEQRSLQGWWYKDYVTWPVMFVIPGHYQVNVTYSCQSGEGGCEYVVEVAGQKLTATATGTRDWSDFRTDKTGVIELQTADQSEVVVRLLKMTGKDALHLQSVALTPVK